ncbi:hypothetical protein N658DRAFT_42163 [Parathielavia hyrcaniae]|uniref:Uncharacterized protein n=1 Tax=Parathielavia hyrcaniae TaxID=113614 RepID=A0AAN6Q1M7_9PEZI|nr:hypothetical protein N658DRAFT_42163 [Parathielavia hyrcaniae]
MAFSRVLSSRFGSSKFIPNTPHVPIIPYYSMACTMVWHVTLQHLRSLICISLFSRSRTYIHTPMARSLFYFVFLLLIVRGGGGRPAEIDYGVLCTFFWSSLAFCWLGLDCVFLFYFLTSFSRVFLLLRGAHTRFIHIEHGVQVVFCILGQVAGVAGCGRA